MAVASTRVRPFAHGTWQKHRYERCQCDSCRTAGNAHRRAREHARLAEREGNVPSKVDAGPVRRHVLELMAQGIGANRVALLAGVSRNSVCQLLYGQPSIGQRPSSWVRPETARRLLAVTAGETAVDA